MENIETILQEINDCNTAIDLEKIVNDYLKTKSDVDDSPEATYIEIAQQLGGDRVLERATLKLFELDTGWLD